ncbi:thioredoxin family protein, partial [Acinetobacter baumannii]
CALTPQAAPVQKIDWNDKKLHWMSYETGMARLKASGKPGILIIYADWCPTCKTYSKLFNNPDVVKALQGLVLIRANEDEERAVSRKYN